MKLIIYTSIFLIVSNFAFADVKVNKCDDIENHNQKTSCLTKLKLQAIKENSKEKINIIEGKLEKSHKNVGKSVNKIEEEIATVGKNVKKTMKNIGEKLSNLFKWKF